MGTKRPFDEDLQEFIKHPKHFENGIKHDSFGEDKHSLEASQNVGISDEGGPHFFHINDDHKSENTDNADVAFETNSSGISGHEDHVGPEPIFCSNLFPELFEYNMPRRQIVHYDDTYSSLLYNSPRKEIPIGPDHQADIPENCNVSDNEGISVISLSTSPEGPELDISNTKTDCTCLDVGSIRCVQQHVSEARMNLKQSLGLEKFTELGLNEMGEEVSSNWSQEEEQLFQDVIYTNPVSIGRKFWEELSVVFPFRTKKELVSYYFNVFILRRRAVQNRSNLLAIDSDDDEWWGTRRVPPGVRVEDGEFVMVKPCVDHDSSSEDDHDHDHDHSNDNIVIQDQDNQRLSPNKKQVEESSLPNIENEQEKVNNGGGLRSESYLHWDPPYSTMGSTKGVDLLPTCSMIEEIFGSTKSGKST